MDPSSTVLIHEGPPPPGWGGVHGEGVGGGDGRTFDKKYLKYIDLVIR